MTEVLNTELLNSDEKTAIQLIVKIILQHDCNAKLHIEQRSDDYLSMIISATNSDFLRLKCGVHTKWISLSMWVCDNQIKNSPCFSNVKNRNQRHWKISLDSVDDIINYSDVIIASYDAESNQFESTEANTNQQTEEHSNGLSIDDFSISIRRQQASKSNENSKRNKGNSLLAFPADYCVIDIETTGLDPSFNEIIELAAIRVSNNQIVNTFQSLVKPSDDVDEFIEQLTGITNSMLSTAPRIENILPKFLDFIGDSTIVGHNVNFDLNFIYDNVFDLFGTEFKNNFVDTMRLSKRLYPDLKHHRLKDMVAFFQISNKQMHRALADCEQTYEILEKIRQYVFSEYGTVENCPEIVPAKKYNHKQHLRASDLKTEQTAFDETHPLFNKLCVFTGTLNIPRKQAMQYVLDFGGYVGDRLTKDTNYLIVGNYENIASVKGGKTGKIKKAEDYQLKGYDIQILSEQVFCDMISDFGDDSE